MRNAKVFGRGADEGALTLLEVICILGAVAVLAVLFFYLNLVVHPRIPARQAVCKENLAQIGKAVYAYTQANNEFHPFAWGPANGGGVNDPRGANEWECDASTSLGLLYPQYVSNVQLFRCPSTEDEPALTVSIPNNATAESDPYHWSQRTYSLGANGTRTQTSYGYDARIFPSAVYSMAIAGDMDGSYFVNRDTATSNHEGGQNILYVDGHVSWTGGNFVSNDPLDNIFMENDWCADTDSYLVRGNADLGRTNSSGGSYGRAYMQLWAETD